MVVILKHEEIPIFEIDIFRNSSQKWVTYRSPDM